MNNINLNTIMMHSFQNYPDCYKKFKFYDLVRVDFKVSQELYIVFWTNEIFSKKGVGIRKKRTMEELKTII